MYDGTHSITFGSGGFDSSTGKLIGKNTWTDWFLIPDSRPDVTEAGIVTKSVEIPGRSGSLDLSEWMTGAPVYQDRSGSWTFLVDNGHAGWLTIRDDIIAYLHGKRMKCVLEDDATYYYQGRFKVKPASGEKNSRITIDYVLEPYRYHWNPTNPNDWLWDPFNFERDYTNAVVERRL